MEKQTDVIQVSSPEQDVDVQEEVIQPQQENEDIDVSGIPSSPLAGQGNDPVDEVDERGVPLQNVAREYQRKFEKTQEELAQMKEVLSQIQKNTTKEEQEYTIADLEAYKQQHPEYSAWCEQEKAKIMQRDMLKAWREETAKERAEMEAKQRQQQELQYVATAYPQMFNRTPNGQITSWNTKEPLTQITTQYLQQGYSLAVASKLAYADIAQNGLSQASKQAVKQKAELGDLQRKVTVEGGGVNSAPGNPRMEALNVLKQTGDKKAAGLVMREILKGRGRIQE